MDYHSAIIKVQTSHSHNNLDESPGNYAECKSQPPNVMYCVIPLHEVFFFSFDVDHFKSLYSIYYHIASLSCFGFLALRHVGSQLPNQDWTCTLCTGGQSLNHWATREVPKCHVNSMYRWYNGRIKPFTFIVFLSKTHDP